MPSLLRIPWISWGWTPAAFYVFFFFFFGFFWFLIRHNQSEIFINPDAKNSKTSSIISVNKGKLTKRDHLRIKIVFVCNNYISSHTQIWKQFRALCSISGSLYCFLLLISFSYNKIIQIPSEKYFKYRCVKKCSITQPDKNNHFKP